MAAVSNDASLNALADGASVSSSNNGGGTNTLMALTGSAPVERRTAGPPTDTACYEFSSRSGTGYFVITPAGFVATAAAGAWFYFATAPAPSNSNTIMRAGNSGANAISLTGAGRLSLQVNSVGVYSSGVTLAGGAWYWISHASNSSATVGQAMFGLWDASGNQLDTVTTAATLNTSGVTTGAALVGKSGTLGTLPIYRIGSVRANTDALALIPPGVTPPPAPTVPPMRGWGIAA